MWLVLWTWLTGTRRVIVAMPRAIPGFAQFLKENMEAGSYRAVIDRQMQKNWNVKLLAFGGNTPQVFWCKDVATGLAGFKGKKVRVFNNTMRDFLAGVPFSKVSPIVDIVGALASGLVLYLGWDAYKDLR